jgi:hypothetical protein
MAWVGPEADRLRAYVVGMAHVRPEGDHTSPPAARSGKLAERLPYPLTVAGSDHEARGYLAQRFAEASGQMR